MRRMTREDVGEMCHLHGAGKKESLILELWIAEWLEPSEISGILGIPEGTVIDLLEGALAIIGILV